MYFHKPQEKPCKWGSFQDVQYAIRKNAEKIYQIDPDSIVLCMPLFWGLPPLDYSGFNNHGTNNGATYKNGGLGFDGNDDYVEVDKTTFSGGITGTVCAWILPGTQQRGDIYSEGTSGTTENYARLVINDSSGIEDNIYFQIRTLGLNFLEVNSGDVNVQDGNQHFICGRMNSRSSIDVFFDGVLKASDTSLTVNATNPDLQTIGCLRRSANAIFFKGIINEVQVSNIARTVEQIALFHDCPWALYQPVSRPIYFFQAAAGLSIPVAMQNMRGGFNPIGIRGGFINAG